jgi:hypothetical protein
MLVARLFAAALASAASALPAVHYVVLNSTNATPPYISWATAATNIQDAVDAAVAGDEIVVTNGTYRPVGVNKALSIRSINGPQFTFISSYVRGGSIGPCVGLHYAASLAGFSLSGGYSYGWGGGASGGTLNNCTLSGNSARYYGGGAYNCTLNNCTLAGNSAGEDGGGAYQCTLNNCTITDNSVTGDSGHSGGAYQCTRKNCVSFGNIHRIFVPPCALCIGDGHYQSVCEDCHSPGSLDDLNNWFGDPLFVDYAGGNLRLQSNSPCINAGKSTYVVGNTDLDGNLRLAGGTVDIGAYEFQNPGSRISYAWLLQYGLPINNSVDLTDPDGDGLNNWQEWRCQTDPTNALSALRLLPPATDGANVIVTWQSVPSVSYFLERSANLAASPAFFLLATNVFAPSDTTTFTDTNAVASGPFFYRVGVGTR